MATAYTDAKGSFMIRIFNAEEFLKNNEDQLFYVGFLKGGERWIPLSLVSEPEEKKVLDTLFISAVYPLMSEMVESYAGELSQIEETFVQYLMPREIRNLMERYGFEKLAFIDVEEEASGGCGCGCNCH
jgi:ubiquinone/menaquinone biosynthesis C-methylase UbiE